MTLKLSFCVKAARDLNSQDLDAITESIGHYQRAGMDAVQAETAAVNDLLAAVQAEHDEMVGALKAQHPHLFSSDRPALPQRERAAPATLRGSAVLGTISNSLDGLSPTLLPDLSQKRTITRTSKLGKQTTYIAWDNPPASGVGPLFRAGGTSDLAEVARLLEESGYLTHGTTEADGNAAARQAGDIIKAELANPGSTLQVGNAAAIDETMRARTTQAEEEPWDSFMFDPDDLEASGYDAADPAVRAATEALVQEAEAAGIDTESLKDGAVRKTEGESDHAYQQAVQTAVQRALLKHSAEARGLERAATATGDQGGGQPAVQAGPAGSESTAGRTDRPDLKLVSQSSDELKAKAARDAAAVAADKAEQKRLADKARIDAQAGDFTLTGSDRAADQNPDQGVMFSENPDFQDTELLARPEVSEGAPAQQDVDALAKIEGEFRKKVEAFKGLRLTALPRRTPPGKNASEAEAQRYAASDLAEKLFGKRVVYFNANMQFANGLQADYLPGMIFVSENTTRPIQAVLGHELTHSMRADHPELYNRLGDRLRGLLEEPGRYGEHLNSRRAARGMEPLNFDKLREELIADIVGDNFTDPQFWRQMAKGQPNLFGRVLRVIKDFFDNLLAKLKNERPYGTGKYLNDIQAARDAVVEAMSQFASSPKTAAAAAVTAAEANLTDTNDPFYSELARQVEAAKMSSAPAQGWKDWLKGLVNKGTAKADELAWTGLEDFLNLQQGKVSREQVMDFLNGNGVKVTETTLGGANLPPTLTDYYRGGEENVPSDAEGWLEQAAYFEKKAQNWQAMPGADADTKAKAKNFFALAEEANEMAERLETDSGREHGSTKYSQYTLPGGSNYREVLLTLPTSPPKMNYRVSSAGGPVSKLRDVMDFDTRKEAEVELASRTAEHPTQQHSVMDFEKLARDGGNPRYQSSHWDAPNVLAHIRLNDRTDSEGRRTLFVEEIQSDWAQQGKKQGFQGAMIPQNTTWEAVDTLDRFDTRAAADNWIERNPPPNPGDNMEARLVVREVDAGGYDVIEEQRSTVATAPSRGGVPRAPFVGKTDAWVSLAIKRVIKMAVDEGYDRVAFVNGEQSAERYDLSKQISRIHYDDNSTGGVGKPNLEGPPGRGMLTAYGMDGQELIDKHVNPEELPDLIGKEAAQRLMDAEPQAATRAGIGRRRRELSGLDLKVGGEGMKAFYDKIVPTVAKDVVKKLGGQMGTVDLTQPSAKPSWVNVDTSVREGPGEQSGFDITPSMREKAAGGLPMFSLQYTPEEEEALQRAGINTRTRLQRAGDRIKLYYGNAQNALHSSWARQFQQGALDQFTGINQAIKREIGALPTDQDPYVAARLANGGTSSVMRGLMLHGQAKWAANGQHLEKIPGTDGLLDILKPLGTDLNSFFGWMIGNRAARLMREGRENNFTPDQIKALQGLNKGKEDAFRKAALGYAAFKRSVLDVAEQAGLLDPESRKVWDNADYIPFYREIDKSATFSATGKSNSGPVQMKGLAGQSSGIRTLKGGESALNDPMENILMNFSRLIDASLKNSALAKTVNTLTAAGSDIVQKVGYSMNQQIVPADQVRKQLQAAGTPQQILDIIPPEAFEGMAKMWAIQQPTDPTVVRVMVGGKPQFYRVNDPLLLKALTSFVPFDLPGLGVARAFKRVLTSMVTSTPEFMARNFIRDTAATAIITRDGFNPAKSLSGIVKSYKEAGAFEDLLFAGASFQSGHINAADPVQTGKAMRRALREKGFDASSASAFMSSIIDTPIKFWEKYRHVGESIENANREAVYEAAIKSGKGATGAAFESKDLMDFSLRGSSPMYQLLADVLPFFNARVQGLYRVGRADPKRVAVYGTLLMLATLALAYANGDNDDYDKLPDWDKETYWHFWIKGEHFRIPKPFELGAVFASVPERIMRYTVNQDSGKKTLSRIWAILRDQLAFDPVPQLVRPALNAWANKDTFRDRPLENQSDEGKLPSQRYSKITSPTAVAVTKAIAPVADEIGLSPKKLEYLVGGYLGTAGLYALGLSDMAMRAMSNEPPRPATRLDQIPLIGSFYRQEPAVSTVYETDLYKMRTEIDQVYKSIKALKKDDKDDEAEALAAKNEKLLEARKVVEHGTKALSKLNKERDAIYADREMTPKQKRAAIDDLLRERADVSKEAMKSDEVISAQ